MLSINPMKLNDIKEHFIKTRKQTENICVPLVPEDYSVQPIVDVSPPKWHLAHTTWFFEQFVLVPHQANYSVYSDDFAYLFNSYYNNAGERVLRPNRGLMTRPITSEVMAYRKHVTMSVLSMFDIRMPDKILDLIEIGINHEEQHQELLAYDIKYILGHQPTFPTYDGAYFSLPDAQLFSSWVEIDEGIYHIGHQGNSYHFDNEASRHKVYLQKFSIANSLVNNRAYIDFIEDGGYQNFNLWHAEGWDWVQKKDITAPEYWHKIDGTWHTYQFDGLQKVNLDAPVMHVSYYEAFAFAEWVGARLPTEFEWEVASDKFEWGNLWEWTGSAYLPYPGFTKAPGALGEYNGKFMVSQHVLRGASVATPEGHSRKTYRNFFHPNLRWMFSGIRLAK